jgi:hypothetical protein
MAEKRRGGRPKARARERETTDSDLSGAEDIATGASPRAQDDDAERGLARLFAAGVPAGGAIAAIVVGRIAGLGPAVLVLAGTALIGTIGFFWASLRTLSGDAPLPEGVASHALVARALAPEKKREALRALKDLELEHSVGKIDDADYAEMSGRYRATAKALMRELDVGLAPQRERAEKLVASYLAKRDVGAATPEETLPTAESRTKALEPAEDPRKVCPKCAVSNEPDAAFCKKCGAPLAGGPESTAEKVDASA